MFSASNGRRSSAMARLLSASTSAMLARSSTARNLAGRGGALVTARISREGRRSKFGPGRSPQGPERRSQMSMSVGVLDHYNVSTRRLGDTVRFYEDILGLVNGPRPPFDFPGAWLYSEGHPVLHLNDISPTDKQQPADSGGIGAIACRARGFDALPRP